MDNNITINLKLVGSMYTMSCPRNNEALYREAADLIEKEYKKMLDRYGNNSSVKEKDLIAYTLLQVALRLKSLESEHADGLESLDSLNGELTDFLKTL